MKIFFKSLARIISTLFILLLIIWFTGSQPLFVNPVKTNPPEVSAKKLESHVRHLSQNLPVRIAVESHLNETVKWIEQQLQPFNDISHSKYYRQSYKVDNETFHNVLLEFTPANKAASEEIIIIGAHYDTADGLPGADDNASGIAALLELAKLLSNNRDKLNYTVQLAFYALEEPPYFRTDKMGSYIHASKLKEQGRKVKLMISLDMIGYFTNEENSQNFPFPLMDSIYPTQGNFIALIANLSNMSAIRKVKTSFKRASDLPVYSFNAPAFVGGIDFSDHLNFWYHGYPALMVTDTSFNRNKNYHTLEDTAEKLDYEKMAKVVKGLFQTILDLNQH